MARAASRWTSEQDDAIRASYPAHGPSIVAARLGRTVAAVRARASKLGVSRIRRNMGHVKLTSLQRSEVVRRYRCGGSAPQIASEFGVSADVIYSALRAADVSRDKAGERNRKITAGAIIRLHDEGRSQIDIANSLAISQSTVSSALRGAGVQRRVRGFSKCEIAEIIRRYEAGESACEIAPEFDVFHARVLTILRAHGVAIRKSTRVRWTDARGRSHHFRSKWELWTAQQLDAAGLDWTFEERFYPVLVNGKMRRYTPDFWVRCGDTLVAVIDVKGKTCVEQMKKIVLFQEQHPDVPFELWTGGVLRSMGVGVAPSEATPFAVAQRVTSCGGKTYG